MNIIYRSIFVPISITAAGLSRAALPSEEDKESIDRLEVRLRGVEALPARPEAASPSDISENMKL